MDRFKATSPRNLRDELGKCDIQVPPRPQRAPEHGETWVSCRFLAAISGSDLLDYPFDVIHQDKPDIVLRSRSGSTGIEITEAVYGDQARLQKRREKNGKNGIYYPLSCRAGEQSRSRQAFEKLVSKPESEPCYPEVGDFGGKRWVDDMLYFMKKKFNKFIGYEKHERNWLLVYDNLSPALDLDDYALTTNARAQKFFDLTTNACAQKLFRRDWGNPFDRVFILRTCGDVWEFSRDARPVLWSIRPFDEPVRFQPG